MKWKEMHQSAEESDKEDIHACCFNCRDESLWGRIFYDFIQRFMKFAVSVSLQVNVMSTVPLQQDSRFDVLINCLKVQMASLISISHFSFFSFCHSWKTAIYCLYFTLRFSLTRLTRLKTFIRWQVNFFKKEYTLLNYHYLISY